MTEVAAPPQVARVSVLAARPRGLRSFKLIAQGEGGVSDVFSAKYKGLNWEQVAVKEIRLQNARGCLSTRDMLRVRLLGRVKVSFLLQGGSLDVDIQNALYEAKLLQEASADNQFIVKHYLTYVNVSSNCVSIVTELCVVDVGQLTDRWSFFPDERGPLDRTIYPGDVILYCVTPIFEAVAFLHQKGIVHRDLKEDNILINMYGVPKLCDFGLAVKLDSSGVIRGRSDDASGTDFYIAPEVILGRDYSTPIDSWSLAVTMLRMLSGSESFGVLKKTWLDLMELLKHVDVSNEMHVNEMEEELHTKARLIHTSDELSQLFAEKTWPSFIEIVTQLLKFKPENRATPDKVLRESTPMKAIRKQWQLFMANKEQNCDPKFLATNKDIVTRLKQEPGARLPSRHDNTSSRLKRIVKRPNIQ